MNGIDRDPSGRLRKRAQLLEFLKFRVLAAQETFFDAWRLEPASSEDFMAPTHGAALPPLDLVAFRRWLQPLCPESAGLTDSDLRECLEQAQCLYLDPGPRRRA